MATCFGLSFKLEISWGTAGTFCIFLLAKYSEWCVHGHWIHMERSYEVNVLITSVFWFNPACSIYVKILWWYSCPQLCLLSDNSRYQIWIYNKYIFLPGDFSSIDSKWYTGLPCIHWKHTSLILVLDYGIFTMYWWVRWSQNEACYFLHYIHLRKLRKEFKLDFIDSP